MFLIKKSSAQITDIYTKETLMGKKIVAVINFPNEQIGPMMSEHLVTGFHRNDSSVMLTTPDINAPNETRLG